MEISQLHLPQVERQRADGTHRSDEPVSKSMRKVCGGVPMLIVPIQ